MRTISISILVLSFAAATQAALIPDILVKAGDYDRRNVVVSVQLPKGLTGVQQLRGSDGKTMALQRDKDSRGWFVIDSLNKGGERTYKLATSERPQADHVQVQKDGKRLKATASGRGVLFYQAEPSDLPRPDIKPAFQRGGYIHPLLTPGGKLVTDDYPPNHIHHHGVWWAWTHTEFQNRQPDFWNMGQGKGRGEFVGIDQTWNGPVHGGFRARHQFVDLTGATPVPAVLDEWEVRMYPPASGAKYWMLDLTSKQTCAGDEPLKLPKYHYGGLGFRGNWAWNGKDKCFFLTSEGETDREKGNFTRGRWCDMWGEVDGTPAGVAILDHPDNFRAPQPMRLHPSEPFFCYAPQQEGDMSISPGKPYVSRYRFIVHDGPPDKKELERLWNDFAHPPSVAVVE